MSYPVDKRFNHICPNMRKISPQNFTDLLGVDGSYVWSLRVVPGPLNGVEVLYCPYCGGDLSKIASQWAESELWQQ